MNWLFSCLVLSILALFTEATTFHWKKDMRVVYAVCTHGLGDNAGQCSDAIDVIIDSKISTSDISTMSIPAATLERTEADKKHKQSREDIITNSMNSKHIRNQLDGRDIIAAVIYDEIIERIGWSSMILRTSSDFDDDVQMYAAGYLEGFSTYDRINQTITNLDAAKFNTQPVGTREKVNDWVYTQLNYTKSQVTKQKDTSVYWRSVGLVMNQTEGLARGYADAYYAMTKIREVPFDLLVWNHRPDFSDILGNIFQTEKKSCWEMSSRMLSDYIDETCHCSSLSSPIKHFSNTNLKNSNAAAVSVDFAVGHATWTDYRDMLRIFKAYEFNLRLPYTSEASQYRGTTWDISRGPDPIMIMTSSYPGLTSSYDDYYVLANSNQQLIVTETTNAICDKSLWAQITPQSMLTSQRALTTILLGADSGASWLKTFAVENSGTYNNQWMVIDNKLFDAKSQIPLDAQDNIVLPMKLPAGFFTIGEQMPKKFKINDVTEFVNTNGYWGSYNKPYDTDIFNSMGYTKTVEAKGDYYSWKNTARAKIFQRDFSKGQTIDGLMRLMRYNQFQTDPISGGVSAYAISSRADLLPMDGGGSPKLYPSVSGGTDVKIATMDSIKGIRHDEIDKLNLDVVDFVQNTDIHKSDVVINGMTMKKEVAEAFPYAFKNARTTPINKNKFNIKHDRQTAFIYAISGPTNDDQATFSWSSPFSQKFMPIGHPDTFDFTWIEFAHTQKYQ